MVINTYQFLRENPNFSRRLNCRELMFTQYDCPQTEKKERFYLEHNLIAYVVKGKRIFHRNNKKWDLTEDTCVFIRKGTHIAEIADSDVWCVMAFFIPDYFLKQLITDNAKSLALSNLPPVDIEDVLPLHLNDICRSFFTSMVSYFSQSPPPPESLLELKFTELILSLLSEKENRLFLSCLNQLRDDRCPSLEQIVQSNYTFNLTLAEYANLACMSVPTFQREFKRIFKDTPARWLTRKRLERAAELLQNTDMSVGDITFECGFENQTHFSRVFKEKMGVPPLRFRSNVQAAEGWR